METNNKKKIINIIPLITLLCLFVMLIGSSYAYYVKTIQNGDETRVVIKTSNMLLRYNEGNELIGSEIMPGWSGSLNFSLENYSLTDNAKYNITLKIISPLTTELENNFVYSLTGTYAGTSSANNTIVNVNQTPVPLSDTLLGTGIITPETMHNYTLNVKLIDNNQNQNYLKGKVFVAKILVELNYE